MRDVLQVLSKLPPACMIWEQDQAYIIHRGVMGKHEYPLTSADEVAIWNRDHNVTAEHVRAMDVGCMLGWNAQGAEVILPVGDSTFIYSAPLQVMLSVNANFEEDAAKMAEKSLDQLVEYLNDTSHNHLLTVLRDGNIDLLEANKNSIVE